MPVRQGFHGLSDDGTRPGCLRRVVMCVMSLVAGGAAGCVSVVEQPRMVSSQTVRAGEGDRDDIWAAVTLAMTSNEMAVVDAYYDPPDSRTYFITTIRDEPVRLVLTGPGFGEGGTIYGPMYDGPFGRGGEITIEATVGRFGDPERERRLVRDVARRLEQLSGVRVSPVR